jgi:molecular chaperone GrpE
LSNQENAPQQEVSGQEAVSSEVPLRDAAEMAERVDDSGQTDARTAGLLAEVTALRLEISSLTEHVQEANGRAHRTLADFDNYRKRVERERVDQIKFAAERLLKEMLPVLDNLDRALSHAREARDFDKIIEGIDLIQKQQYVTMERFGLRVIEVLGCPFDPTCHQSIGQTETDQPEQENRVMSEIQKGYRLHDRVLRPSLVTVGVRKSQDAGAGETSPVVG